MIGKIISHYKILEELGRGGMGVVYKAEDLRLKRTVALKFLSPTMVGSAEVKTRFLHEAQAAAALDDSNICAVHEIEEWETPDGEKQLFIVMAYVEGENLKEKIAAGPLKIEEVLNIAIQIAEGLQTAHEKGIMHRDIKPANILLSIKGQVRITDFGLAKLEGRTQVTKEGTTLGTIHYMSPEQARGDKVDHRTDIWSFGVVLYEMLTGQLPFRGEYEQAVIYSIINEEPEPPTAVRSGLSMELERIICKALSKNPDDRYQHLDDVIVDLRLLRETTSSGSMAVRQPPGKSLPKKRNYFLPVIIGLLLLVIGATIYLYRGSDQRINSIAILPFENTNNNPQLEYLCEGIPENITNSLSRLSGLKVISSTSVRNYKGQTVDLKKVAKELKVRALLVGKLIHAGSKLSIRVELVDTRDQRQLWGEEYTRESTAILQIQQDMVTKISEQLLLRLTSHDRQQITKKYTENAEAYQYYLKGLYYWNRFTRDDLVKAVELYKQAIRIDPNYALAYVGLAYAYINLGSHHGDRSPEEIRAKAREAVLKALELDATLGEAYSALANVKFFHDWDWPAAEEAYLKGIKLNPNSAIAHGHYALLLDALGRTNEAIAERKIALELDPLSLKFLDDQALSYMDLGQDEVALKLWRSVLDMDSTFAPPRRGVGRVFLKRGNYEAAIKEFRKGVKFSGRQHMYLGYLGWALAKGNQKQAAREILQELTQKEQASEINAYSIAMIYVGLEDRDSAMEWVEKAYKAHLTDVIFLKIDPIFDTLKSDPRMQTLLSKMRL